MTEVLRERWRALCPDADEVGAELIRRWSEPQRHYHDLRHLADVLDGVDELAGSISVQLAAWWHDAVYDPRAADNEQRSADLAARTLQTVVSSEVVDEVVRLVLLTSTHDPDVSDVDGQILCDADLRVLTRAPTAYDAYVTDVRLEYAHVSETSWRAGRSAVLRQLLALPALFRTPLGQAWEQPARANLTRELASLTGDALPDADPPR